jgi:hypothetical protein
LRFSYRQLKKAFVLLLVIFLGSQSLILANVAPVITDPKMIEETNAEREKIFSALIEDPTNLDYLFKYANLSILLGDLEAAISVFEQMLIYEPDLPRIRLELGVLYFRLNAYPSAKLYLNSVKNYDAPEEVLKKVDSFLNSIVEAEKDYIHQHIFSMGLTRSSNANSGIDQDIIEIAGFPLTVPEGSKPQGDITKNFRYTYTLNQDLNHPRGDQINYVIALTDQRLDSFHRFDTSSIVTSATRTFNLEGNPTSIFSRPSLDASFTGFVVLLADKALLNSHKYDLKFTGSLSDSLLFSIGGFHDQRRFLMNDLKSGIMNGLMISNSYVSNSNILTEIEYEYSKFNAKASYETYQSNTFGLNITSLLGKGWGFKASLSHSNKQHFSPLPVFGERKEELNSIKVEFSKSSSNNCLFANYRISKNDNKSSIDIYARSNLQVTADFSYVCLLNS